MDAIPAIWRIDVEPDDFQPRSGLPPWTGFLAVADLVDRLRERLGDRSGAALRPAWFLRLDPDIEHHYRRADFVVEQYRDRMDALRAHGDPLGIHVHYYRWDEARRVSYSDHADPAWIAHCLESSVHAFEHSMGERPRRASQGAYFVTDAVVDRAAALGIEVDVTAEPGLPALDHGVTFGAYATAPSTDFRQYPRRPYYPSRAALGLVEWDWQYQLIKVNPLASWDRAKVWEYVQQHDVPYNELHDRGYPSIGCAPCTRAVAPGEDQRAGRWWWERPESRECGIHGGPARREGAE